MLATIVRALKAAGEFQVRAPLKEAGLTKAEIREFSAHLGLPTADKPQMACLSSRVPYGQTVTPQKLSMIERAEYVLRDLGFYDVRVRHHELSGQGMTLHLARIEVARSEMGKFLAEDLFDSVAAQLKKIGYAHVTLDLQGYRRGSVNEPAPHFCCRRLSGRGRGGYAASRGKTQAGLPVRLLYKRGGPCRAPSFRARRKIWRSFSPFRN